MADYIDKKKVLKRVVPQRKVVAYARILAGRARKYNLPSRFEVFFHILINILTDDTLYIL